MSAETPVLWNLGASHTEEPSEGLVGMPTPDRHLKRAAFDTIEAIHRASMVEDVVGEVQRFTGQFGMDIVLFTGLPHQVFDKAVIASRWPKEFLELYVKKDYVRFDPVARLGRCATAPFLWDESSYTGDRDLRALEVMHRAADFGLRRGFIVPVPSSKGHPTVVSMSGPRIELPESGTSEIHLVALSGFEQIRLLETSREGSATDLSAREREVLAWVAEGKTSWEIGEILKISTRTVNEHVKVACRKLGAANRAHAVALNLRELALKVH